MMDGCILLVFKIESPIHCRDKAGKSQDIFNHHSDCIRLKEESHIPLGWLEGE